MERSIAISRPTVGSERLYSSIVSTAPGDKTRVHHHGDCETSIYIVSGSARYTWGPTGLEHADDARRPATSSTSRRARSTSRRTPATTDPLVVVLTRNCPDSHVVYLDGGPRRRRGRPGTVLSALTTMTRGWRDRTLLDLLAEYGLELLPEHDFPNDGWSGATLHEPARRVRPRFILKRTSLARDWIARATRDDDLREAWLASRPSGALSWIPRAVVPVPRGRGRR